MATNPVTTGTFGADPNPFPPALYPELISAVIGGNPFADSLTPYSTGNSRAVFGIISDVAGAQWITEASPKPDLTLTAASYIAIAQELAGIALISERAARDTSVNLMEEVQRVLRTFFGWQLDDGLLHGDAAPESVGVLTYAAASAGVDLWSAVFKAKGDIITGGGTPTTVALPPSAIVAEEARLDGDERPMYPDGVTRFAGLDVVAVPALAAAEGLVYDHSGCYLVTAQDFRIDASKDYAPAFQRDSIALRVSGQFTAAVPVPAAAIRKLAITP